MLGSLVTLYLVQYCPAINLYGIFYSYLLFSINLFTAYCRELDDRVPPVPGVGDAERRGGVHLPPLHARQTPGVHLCFENG